MTLATNRIGRIGEQIAVRHLQQLRYAVVERNWRTSVDALRGELDVVAFDGDVLVFCEVKTRRSSGDGGAALDAVTPVKQRQIRQLATAYLAESGRHGAIRFDVIAVTWAAAGGRATVTHIRDAF